MTVIQCANCKGVNFLENSHEGELNLELWQMWTTTSRKERHPKYASSKKIQMSLFCDLGVYMGTFSYHGFQRLIQLKDSWTFYKDFKVEGGGMGFCRELFELQSSSTEHDTMRACNRTPKISDKSQMQMMKYKLTLFAT